MKTLASHQPLVNAKSIDLAASRLAKVLTPTPLIYNLNLSDHYSAEVWLKREDLQVVRSYKIRGAYNKISQLPQQALDRGVVCASAGNHAQGVAYTCQLLQVKGTIVMPSTTPGQKVKQVEMFGKSLVKIVLHGDTYDDACDYAKALCEKYHQTFIHPFDDPDIITGQGTVGKEVWEQMNEAPDFVLVPVGGGGLAAGVLSYLKEKWPTTSVIGFEPEGAPSMRTSLSKGHRTAIDKIDKFVDGAAVKEVGQYTFKICKTLLDEMITVPEGLICSTILNLYNRDAIVVEPAGALTIAGLSLLQDRIEGKKVVAVVSGSNNDITRMEEIKERSLMHEGLKHYFMVRFPQRAGALKEFVAEVLGPNDDITHFEYTQKNHREKGPAFVGIQLRERDDFEALQVRMKSHQIECEYLNNKPDLLRYLL